MTAPAPSLDARKRPTGRLGEDLILGSRELSQSIGDTVVIRHPRPQAGIPQRDASITNQATLFGAFDGASAKKFAKVSFAQPQEPLQSWKVERFVLRRQRRPVAVFLRCRKNSWLELRFSHNRCAPVPRANCLADVAAANMIAHCLAELFGDRAAQFNLQIGNALSGIHDVGFYKLLRRTGVPASPPAPAQVRRR